jgi:hypothetical protein
MTNFLGRPADAFLDRARGGGWAPSDFSGLVLWLDNTLITEAGGKNTAWPDLSGLGNHGVQANPSLQGDYEALGWNGAQPSVHFTAASEHVIEANGCAAGFSGDDTPWTITWTAQRTAAESAGEIYVLGLGRASTGTPAVRTGQTAGRWSLSCRDDAGTEETCLGAAGSSLVTTRHQFTDHFDGTTRSLFVDGALVASNTTTLGAITFDRFYLGHWRTVSGYNFRTPGMTIYNRALTAPELALLWQYNRDHFGGLP